jgi:hypothetical protein
MNVVSYYQPIENSKFSNESCELLKKWESNWKSMGWNPIILNEDYSKKNIYHDRINFNDYSSILYSGINNPNYLKQCYMRWLAYTQFVFENGATLWCDYDVYNKTFTLERFGSLNDTEQLFCASGAVGIMKPNIANEILSMFEKVYLSTSLEDLKDIPNFHKNYFTQYKDTFSDMILIQAIFLNPPTKLKKLCCSDRQDYQKTIKDFDLFHIHGGVKAFDLFHIHGGVVDETNKNGLFFNCLDFKKMTRSQQWEYIENLLKNSSLNEIFSDLIFKINNKNNLCQDNSTK